MAYLSIKDGRFETTNKNGKGRSLTPKMLSFINAYFGLANFNAIEAMRMSDYKCTTPGSISMTTAELMNHPLVKAEIQRRLDLREQKSEVKAEYLINKLMQIIEKEQEENPSAALRAIELAGKSIALWKERQEISGPDGEAIQHEQRVKESVAEFTDRIASLADKSRRAAGQDDPRGAPNIIGFPGRSGKSGT